MAKNKNLQNAKASKNDEFYTRLEDIEQELYHYRNHFKGKTVYLNCDNPYRSDFFKYFTLNFDFLGLKKLICTNYSSDDLVDNEGNRINEKAYKAVVTQIKDFTGDGRITFDDVLKSLEDGVNEITELDGDGDFRSEECIDLLKESDIVVTNPPFSLFREYIGKLMEYEKKFIVWANNNAITYKEIFPLIKENEVWLGYTANKTLQFRLADHYKKWDEKLTEKHNDGWKYGKVPAISVFTNLDIPKRHIPLTLAKRYKPEEYPKYDNYDAIEVSKVAHIPYNYEGVMGVPITFLTNYSPEQFEIIGLAPERLSKEQSSLRIKYYTDALQHKKDGSITAGGKVNDGPTILHEEKPNSFPYYTSPVVEGKFLKVLYARILIRNKHPEI